MPPEEHSPSLREALAASWDTAGSDAGSVPASTTSTDAGAAPAASTAPGGERTRDASGRFSSTAAGAEAAAPATTGQAAPADDAAPDGYNADLWAQLSPEARAATSSWAKGQRDAVAERDGRLKAYEPYDRVIDQSRRDALTMEFGGVPQALERLFNLSDMAGRDPAGFIRLLAQQRGVDLAQLVGQGGQQAGQGQNPAAQQPADIGALVKQAVQEQRLNEDTDRAYTEFMADTAAEHRNDTSIRKTMTALLMGGVAPDYRTAYAMATQAHPEIGPKLRAAEAAKAVKADGERAAQDASKKASAAVSVTGAPGTASASASDAAPDSIRAGLEKAWNSQGGRA